MNADQLTELKPGDAIVYRLGSRAQRTGKVVAVTDDGRVSVTYDHDQLNHMDETVTFADIERVES